MVKDYILHEQPKPLLPVNEVTLTKKWKLVCKASKEAFFSRNQS